MDSAVRTLALQVRSVRRAFMHAYCSVLAADAQAKGGEPAAGKHRRSGSARGFVPWDDEDKVLYGLYIYIYI